MDEVLYCTVCEISMSAVGEALASGSFHFFVIASAQNVVKTLGWLRTSYEGRKK